MLTLRGDFYGHALAERRLSDQLQGRVVNIGPMTRDELRTAIQQPPKRSGCRFEDGLVERILEEVGAGTGRAPAPGIPAHRVVGEAAWRRVVARSLQRHRRGSPRHCRAGGAGFRSPVGARAGCRSLGVARARRARRGRRGYATARPIQELDALARNVIGKLASDRLLVTTRDATGPRGRRGWARSPDSRMEALARMGRREYRDFLRPLRRLEEEAEFWETADHDSRTSAAGRPSFGRRPARCRTSGRRRWAAESGPMLPPPLGRSRTARLKRSRRTETAAKQRQLRRTRVFAIAASVLLLLAIGSLGCLSTSIGRRAFSGSQNSISCRAIEGRCREALRCCVEAHTTWSRDRRAPQGWRRQTARARAAGHRRRGSWRFG